MERFGCRGGVGWWVLFLWGVAAGQLARGASDGGGASRSDALLSVAARLHWAFEEGEPGVLRESAGGATWDVAADVPRVAGVHGHAVRLSGVHQLATAPLTTESSLAEITFSAWVRPTDLSGYREIYRQECHERLLFSFQGDGTILSLGLNVGGYVECDAPIDPAEVMDGGWHHVAATFDGQWMRVYLDGREIGRLERSGTILTNGLVPAFIASSSGVSEHFQGALDELRIYDRALTDEQIGRIHQAGIATLAVRLREVEQRVGEVYVADDGFPATLARLRRALQASRAVGDDELVGVALARLRADFPDDYAQYVRSVGFSPGDYLRAEDNEAIVALAERLVVLMLEYEPLTEHQWDRLSEDDRRRWEDARRIADRFAQLKRSNTLASDSPAWIDVLLGAGRHVAHRPAVSEAVAPYRTPETPVTRDLTLEQSRQQLRHDWLHQANGQPTPERIRDEIRWTRELAARLADHHATAVDLSGELARLSVLEARAIQIEQPDEELYFQVREVKRAIAFKNPVIDFERVLLVDMPLPQGSEWQHETRHRLGYMAVPGGRLLVLEGLSPAGRLRQLMPQPPLHGSFWRPDLSFDAQRVLFCFKPHNEKSFHLYQINVDGTGLTQLTDGPYDDLDPIYLPGGEHVMFSTTRGHTYVRCMPPTNAYVLARCDNDGQNIYLISRNNEPDYLPSVLDDGRVVYTRWEYTDKPLWRAQGLWTVNPDGTQVNTLWGNQSVWPDLLKDARGVPGSRRIMFTGSAHHDWFAGSVGLVDPARGFNFPDGLTKVTADVEWPESGNGPVDPIESPRYHASGVYRGYYSPFPLSEQDFLVSANRGGKFVLYLMDVDGNRELVYEGVHHILHAIPCRPRPEPPELVDRVAWPGPDQRLDPLPGVIYSGNVYQGAPEALQGKARYLRILNIEPKTYTYWHKRPYLSTGPVVSAVQSDGVKRVLGTVEIERDGSVAFEAPSGVALHFQLLDQRHRALQTMRSFTGVMPGEQRGCLGCHASHSRTPEYHGSTLALAKAPQPIVPPPWGDETVSYERFVRPVLNQYCVSCHEGEGQGRAVLDFTPREGLLGFDETYWILTGRPSWGAPYAPPADPPPGFGIANTLMVEGYDQRDPEAYQTPEPLQWLSYNSPLIDIASSGEHHGVRVDEVSLQRLIAWVDTMCPYRGAEEVRAIEDPDFQGIDWLSVRPQIKSAPRIVRPGPVD